MLMQRSAADAEAAGRFGLIAPTTCDGVVDHLILNFGKCHLFKTFRMKTLFGRRLQMRWQV